jgi:pimeloyl-ACP methyl ester carboxylesterase
MTIFFYIIESLLVIGETLGAELLFLGAMLLFSVLIAGVLAPLNALSWWAGWSNSTKQATVNTTPSRARVQSPDRSISDGPDVEHPNHYIVYLSGIGDVSHDSRSAVELDLMDALSRAMPRTRLIHDIFAFSVTNVGLTEEELMGRFWRWMKRAKSGEGRMAAVGSTMISGRNVLQVAVSADRRYGPVFNYGTASTILQHLQEVGFEPGSGVPVTLLGYSGGGQVVLASSQYLKPALNGPLQVISVGGVLADSPGVDAADEVIHIEGTTDGIQRLGDYLFPQRWSISRSSRWNRALASGKIRRIVAGPMGHAGAVGYFGSEGRSEDGRTYLEITVDLLRELTTSFRERSSKSYSNSQKG